MCIQNLNHGCFVWINLTIQDYPGFSPEKSSILKRKASFGSTYSGSHSPEGTSEGTR